MKNSANLAEKFTKYFVHPGPKVAQYEANATVEELRTQAQRAPKIVGEITGLTEAAKNVEQIPIFVLNRAKWAGIMGDFAEKIISYARVKNMGLFGKSFGAVAISFASTKLLGQYDPFGSANLQQEITKAIEITGDETESKIFADSGKTADDIENGDIENKKLLLLAPNLSKFQLEYQLDRRDVALWLCVHELTHAVQFMQAPWLRAYLLRHIGKIIVAEENNKRVDDCENELQKNIETLQNVMTILEGHAQYVMNSVSINVMPSRQRIVEALRKKRENVSFWQKKMMTIFGFNKKIAQYERGEEFVKFVVARAGMDNFNKIWESPENFPCAKELDQPHLWLARFGMAVE